MNDIWWYEIHCPDCGTLMRKKSYKACPDCGNPQAICLPPEPTVPRGLMTPPDEPCN